MNSKKLENFSKQLAIFTIVSLALSLLFVNPQSVEAATFTFTQTDWSGGSSGSTAVHPTNQNSWNYSSSASSTIATSTAGQVSLASTTASVTKTTDADFSGTHSSTTVSGTGTGASVNLYNISGLAGGWRFNESSGSTAADQSGNNNSGTLNYIATSTLAGNGIGTTGWNSDASKINNALKFNTSSCVDVGNSVTLQSSVFTYVAWFKGYQTLIGGEGPSNYPQIFIADNGRAALNKANIVQIGVSTGTFSTSTWNHIAVSYDALGNYIFYINGVVSGSGTNLQTFAFGNMCIGGWGAYPGLAFIGLIDEVAIYNRVLNSSEIAYLYNFGSGRSVNNNTYYSSGTYTSQTIDTGQASSFTTLGFTKTTNASTTLTVDIRAGNTATPDGTWTSWQTNISNGGSISALNGNRYVQYRANLSTTDVAYTPSLDDITINYSYYSNGVLTSSAYDTTQSSNLMGALSWNEDASLPSGTGVTVSLRTASTSANLGSAAWTDFINSTTGCSKATSTVTCGSSAIPASMKDGVNDQWFQYKISLTGGTYTPTVNTVKVQYVVNAPPQFNPDYPTTAAGGASASQNSTSTDANWGKVQINYSIRDTDTLSGSVTPGYITPSLEYNVGGGWVSINSAYLSAGDTNNKAVSQDTYTAYGATWNAKSQIPGTYYATAQVRVTANDNEIANNTSSTASAAFALDAKNPTSTAFTINGVSSTITFTLSDDSNIQYRLSNNSDFSADLVNASSGVWIAVGGTSTSTTLTWTGSGTYPTVYLNTRDIYGNTATSTVVAPSTPTGFSIKDISNPTANTWGEFITWVPYSATSSAAFANYKLYRSSNNTNYSLLTTITNSATNYYQDNSVASSTTYYYKLLNTDTDGDISAWSSVVSDYVDGQGGTDNIPPLITNVSSTVQATWVKISWTTDELSNSEIGYSISPDTGFGNTASSTSYVISHEITLTGLTPNTTYLYRVRSADILNNLATANNSGAGYSFTTLGGPSISEVVTETITNNSANITWNTNKSSNSYVVYSVNLNNLKAGSNISEVGSALMIAGPPYQHRVQISGLTQRTTYYYYVKSTDSDNNLATDTNGGNYYTFNTTYDTKPPVISNLTVPVITKTAAIVNWQTDEDATSQVEYSGTSGSYTSVTTLDNTLSIYHAVVLTDLSKNTKYYLHAKSTDASGNATTSVETNFTTSDTDVIIISTAGGSAPAPQKDTTPPAISGIEATDVGAFGATIAFTTSESATSFVLYGRDPSYGSTAGSSDYATEHKIKLSSLRPGTKYNFKVKAQDKDGNIGISGDNTFTTKYASEALEETVILENASQFQDRLENLIESTLPSLVPPFIGGVEVASTTENSAVVSWRSNVSSYGALAYASENDYGANKENPYTIELSSGDKKERDHTVNMTGLSPSTVYHIQAKGFVIPGAVGKSKDITFITKASRIRAEVTRLGNTDVDVRWTSPTDTSSFVEYRNLRSGKIGRTGDDMKIKSHAITVKDLEPDTSYQLRVFGYDNNNNIAEGDPITIRTKKDITPPEISNIRIDNALLPGRSDRLQSVVSWRTDEPANSVVYFEEGVGINEVLANKVGQEKEYNTDHIVIITSLKPSTIYRIQISSADESGNLSKSPIRSILTPRSAESVLDVITRNLQETFGFLKNINQ